MIASAVLALAIASVTVAIVCPLWGKKAELKKRVVALKYSSALILASIIMSSYAVAVAGGLILTHIALALSVLAVAALWLLVYRLWTD